MDVFARTIRDKSLIPPLSIRRVRARIASCIRDRVTYSQSKECLIFERGSRILTVMARKKLPAEVREYFARMGKKGGLLGGKARAAKLTPEERSVSARKAVQARWEKERTSENR